MRKIFNKFSNWISSITGSPLAFIVALIILVIWYYSKSFFPTSDSWQLFINSFTTIITFLMVFLIQNSQNRNSKALHLKIDELIRAQKGARTGLMEIENMTDEELDALQGEFSKLKERGYGKIIKNLQIKIEEARIARDKKKKP